ncbi:MULTISPECIES: TIGR04104 family putative zinc finger protein [Planococcus]|uniref:Cxxc_20_cxxc protein n=1 Tax=Planococcus wigleyi TaxID=2762216 RepID=A0ABR8WBS0_9BACL|nr:MULTISPECIES: TIGR04104 family putative zinc finger protein [Planococcus]MBD8014478.1 hypothetical protein [Planococcus wigleyi]MDN3436705.1 hypothetical protein [Planococcus sp. APC 3900]
MPNCENCGRKWQWKTIVSKTLKLTNKVTCPYCGKPQYIVPKSRVLTGFFSFLPTFIIIMIGMVFDINVWQVLLSAAGLLLVFLAIYPFTMKLASEDKSQTLL